MADFSNIIQKTKEVIHENEYGEITSLKLRDLTLDIINDINRKKLDTDAVEANPTGLAVASLDKIKIKEKIYEIPQTDITKLEQDIQDVQQGLSNKLDTISDLATIRNNAAAGATAVQQVTVGTTTTGEAGSSANVTNSGTSTAPVLNFTIPKGNDGQDAINPFKGWYNAVVTGEAGSRVITSETQNLPSNPAVGDYAYVKTWEITGTAPDQVETPIAKIYECVTAGSWSNSGMTVDTSNVQTFASSERVNEVSIINDLITGGKQDVLSAEQGMELGLHAIGGVKYNNSVNIDLTSFNIIVGSFDGSSQFGGGKSYVIPISNFDYTNIFASSNNSYCWMGFSNEEITSYTEFNTKLLMRVQIGNTTGKIIEIPSEIDGYPINFVYVVRNRSTNIYNTSIINIDTFTKYSGVNTINLSKAGEVYATKAKARSHVPTDMRFKGVELHYLMPDGFVHERFVGSDFSNDNDWENLYDIDDFVSVKSQSLLFEEKEQARNNLGINGDIRTLNLKGAGITNAATPHIYSIRAGNTYRLWLKNPNVPSDEVVVTNPSLKARFDVYLYDSTNALLYTPVHITCSTIGSPLADYYDIDIPIGVNSMRVLIKCNSGEILTMFLEDITCAKKNIYPKLMFGYISNTGSFMEGSPSARGLATPRFVKLKSNVVLNIEVPFSGNYTYRIAKYDKDFDFIEHITVSNASGNLSVGIEKSNAEYIKLAFSVPSSFTPPIPQIKVSLTGVFDDAWDTFNIRPSDNGYCRITALVNITNPNCCDEATGDATIKDSQELLVDYGVIALPAQYKNSGEATRMIIYCHGAAVNYSSSVIRFGSDDIEPEYWLAEGYAVMDIEGNPFNNTDEHVYTPQAMDSYVAAYKWAIEHFNIKRDGVFIGGRSMGGANVFNLISNQCSIPVIAACTNVPSVACMGSAGSAKKSFFATHCGLIVPFGFSWSNTYTEDEKQVFLTNWDKVIKNNPIMRMIVDLPVTDEFKESFIDCFVTNSEDRVNLLKVLHMISKCPVKLFGCNQDTSCPPHYTSELLYKMLKNSAQIVELRLFNTSLSGSNAHHYELKDSALRTTITTRFGVEMTNVPVVYIEMLQFWRRYEQGN